MHSVVCVILLYNITLYHITSHYIISYMYSDVFLMGSGELISGMHTSPEQESGCAMVLASDSRHVDGKGFEALGSKSCELKR